MSQFGIFSSLKFYWHDNFNRPIHFVLRNKELNVHIYDIVKIIWTRPNYRNAIKRKCLGHWLPLSEVKSNFEKWCHRDNLAKEQLNDFDFAELESGIIRHYREFLLQRKEKIQEAYEKDLKEWETTWNIFK